MTTRLRRHSYLHRASTSLGIGALALVTGACSSGGEGTDSDFEEPAASAVEEETAAPAAAPEGSTDSDVVAETEEPAETSTDGEGSTDTY